MPLLPATVRTNLPSKNRGTTDDLAERSAVALIRRPGGRSSTRRYTRATSMPISKRNASRRRNGASPLADGNVLDAGA